MDPTNDATVRAKLVESRNHWTASVIRWDSLIVRLTQEIMHISAQLPNHVSHIVIIFCDVYVSFLYLWLLLSLVSITFVITGRMPRSGKLLVLNLLTGQKWSFLPHRGDSLHQFRSNLAGPTGTWVRLAVQNFISIGAGGGNAAPKYQKFPFFGKRSPPVDTPPDRFLKCLGAFIRPTILIATCLSDTMFPRFADLLASTCEHYATFERRLLMTWLKQWLFHLFTLTSTMLTLSFTDPLTSEGCSAYRTQLPGWY